MQQLTKELKGEIEDLEFGSIHNEVTEAENMLHEVQDQIQIQGHNDCLMQEEKKAQMTRDEALHKQNIFWQEIARVNQHLNGDRNSKYFHRVTKIKNKTKIISSIRNNEEMISERHRISEHMVNYCNNLFVSTNTFLQEHLLVAEVIPQMIDDITNNLLIMTPTEDEVTNVAFNFNYDGALGQDGFGTNFFQTYWEIIKKDVHVAVTQFFQNRWLPSNYNANILIPIPQNSKCR